MMIQKLPKHYKSKNEDSISKIRVDIVLLLIFFVVAIIVCIKRKNSITEGLRELISINPFSALILFILLHIIYLIAKSVIYDRKKKLVINKGIAYEGQIEETIYVKNTLNKSPGTTYDYRYRIRLNDGRKVNTEVYYEDFVKNDNINSCTVYEYNNHYYFTDFR